MIENTNYDEDLNENEFFQTLQNEQTELFQRSTLEGWIICVPRSGTLSSRLTDEDFYNHILIPSDELPESHFISLNDTEIRISNNIINGENSKTRIPFTVKILFQETFYTEDMFKYKVLCIERPLQAEIIKKRTSDLGLLHLTSLRDCVDLLWTETNDTNIMQQLDNAINSFNVTTIDYENETINTQKDLVYGLYKHCLNTILTNKQLKEKLACNKHLINNIKLSIETYVQHGIYRKLLRGITANTYIEDAHINKIIRNSSELQLKDLDIRPDLYEVIPTAKQELAHIDACTSTLAKLNCLKKSITIISGEKIVCADDLLPVLIFLVVKISLNNWYSQLIMLNQFRFTSKQFDEYSFLITTLEAAIEHVKTAMLFKPSIEIEPEEQDNNIMLYLINLIKTSKYSIVEEYIKKQEEFPIIESNNTKLCHPLCSCDKCENEIIKLQNNYKSVIELTDDKGLTLLHYSCKYGKLPMVEFLIENNSNINSLDFKGCTPLHYASASGYQHVLLYLLHKNANPDIKDNENCTPLYYAACNGHENCVKGLLYFSEQLGTPININNKNIHGDTALHSAAKWGFISNVQILMEYGANSELKNNRKLSPIEVAHNIHILNKLISTQSKKPNNKKIINEKQENHNKDLQEFVIDEDDFVIVDYGLKPRSNSQNKKVIFGPMFSGKTTELIRRMKRYQVALHKCLIFKYAGDVRYDNESVATHDQQKLPAISTNILIPHKDLALTYDVIGIDEGQFYPDIVEFCESLADVGKVVVVAALDGTYERKSFGNILNLVPLSESVEKLNAVCMFCYKSASFTKRIGVETEVQVIGGADKYKAVCRKCYYRTSPTPDKREFNGANVPDEQAVKRVKKQL